MTDGEALMAAVLAEPEEMAHRLVYADWLDEQGEAGRGELIRVQVELAAVGAAAPGAVLLAESPHGRRAAALTRRQDELLSPPAFWAWFGPLVEAEQGWEARPAIEAAGACAWAVGTYRTRDGGGRGSVGIRWLLTVRRGFVEGVSCPLTDWLACSGHWWGMTPLRVYRPVSAAVGPRDEIMAHGVALWQDERVGRLDTLDLTGLCRRDHPADLECLQALARAAYRPWRGLGRVLLPGFLAGASAEYRAGREAFWGRTLPGVRIDFAPPEDAA